jgi:copper chaperone CopZ
MGGFTLPKASAYFMVNGISGKHDVKDIKRELHTLQGVSSISVGDKRIAVDYDPSGIGRDRIQRKIEKLGYEVSEVYSEDHRMEEGEI